jgi:hypothetical protein
MQWTPQLVALLAACISPALAAIFAVTAYRTRLRRSQTETLSVALYWLLRIRRELVLLNSSRLNEFADLYLAQVEKTTTDVRFTPEERSQLRSFILRAWHSMLGGTADSRTPSAEFQKSIERIAKFDSLAAYSLAVNATVGPLLTAIDRYVEQLRQTAPAEQATVVDSVIDRVQSLISDEVLKDFEDDILTVASRISWVTRWRTSRTIRSLRSRSASEIEGDMRRFVQQVASAAGIGASRTASSDGHGK